MHPYAAESREYYRCRGCGYDDSHLIAFYPQMRYDILPDSELLNYFDGAVIEWEGKILLFHRRLFQFCYAIVAGHWDLDDETPEAAFVREIAEEAPNEMNKGGSTHISNLGNRILFTRRENDQIRSLVK